MKKYFLLLMILICDIQLVACNTSENQKYVNTSELLQRFFPDSIEIKTNSTKIIEYCPDNTCEVFKSINANKEMLSDFTYLYLFFVSDYTYLSEWRANVESKRIAITLLDKHMSAKCSGLKLEASTKCVLKTLAEKFSITISFARYDEGIKSEVPIDINDALR